jgi:hypothetical protein
MWLTENAGDQIARIDPNSDQVSVFPIPIERARPLGIALGPDGDLWFTEYAEGLGQSIGRVTPSGEISEFQTPEAEAGPYGIAAGPDGNMWLTESTKGRIGRIGTGAAAALITPPSISGNGEVTNPQTCNPSTWTTLNAEQPLAGLYGYDGYHWSVEGKVIGAGSPFAPPLADVGQKLYCIQTVSYPQPLLLSDAASSAPVTLRPSPPIITGARLSSSRWREGEKSYRGVKGKKPPVGVTVAFTLNEAAPVSFSFEQRASGRRVKGKCVAETRANAGRGGCRRNIIVRRLLLPGRVNFNHIYFRGGLSGSRLMKPGRYTLVIRSKNANGTAHPASLSFTVLE